MIAKLVMQATIFVSVLSWVVPQAIVQAAILASGRHPRTFSFLKETLQLQRELLQSIDNIKVRSHPTLTRPINFQDDIICD